MSGENPWLNSLMAAGDLVKTLTSIEANLAALKGDVKAIKRLKTPSLYHKVTFFVKPVWHRQPCG